MSHEFPQARDQGATYAAAKAMLDPLTHCARPDIQPASWYYTDVANPVVPQWELLC